MEVIELIEEMRDICEKLRKDGKQLKFVPTMGALHIGHASLIEFALNNQPANGNNKNEDVAARQPVDSASDDGERASFRKSTETSSLSSNIDRRSDGRSSSATVVIVSIFINPKQFNNSADFQNYPNTLNSDLELCKRLGVNYVFLPQASEMYPQPCIDNKFNGRMHCMVLPPDNGLARELEGKSRPGHFEGMLTVVCKLFNIVRPNEAFFGEKDYQQLILVSKMVQDLNLDVVVQPVPTVRDSTLLPFSSRNVRLNEWQRHVAPLMYRILSDVKQTVESKFNTMITTDNGHLVDNKSSSTNINFIILASMLTTTSLSLDKETLQLIDVDYLELRCSNDLSEICHQPDLQGFDCLEGCVKRQMKSGSGDMILKARLLIAIVLDEIRLLDNIEVSLNGRYS